MPGQMIPFVDPETPQRSLQTQIPERIKSVPGHRNALATPSIPVNTRRMILKYDSGKMRVSKRAVLLADRACKTRL